MQKKGINLYKVLFLIVALWALYISLQVVEGWPRIDQRAHEVTGK